MNKNQNPKKIMIIVLVSTLVFVGVTLLYVYIQKKPSPNNEIKPVNTINYSPPTKEELKETETFKNNQPSTEEPTNPSSHVTPIISYAGQFDSLVELSGFIPSKIEDGGTCTAIFSNDKAVVTKTSSAVKDATTTRCSLISFPTTELTPKGNWNVVLQYKSTSSQGTSSSTNFEVK
ncbi:MAG: hypothetical protein U0451_04210 [Candidatus Saccharimonadales bacterium]